MGSAYLEALKERLERIVFRRLLNYGDEWPPPMDFQERETLFEYPVKIDEKKWFSSLRLSK